MSEEIYHFTLGKFQCTALVERNRVLPADQMYTTVPEDELKAVVAEFGLEDGVPSAFNVLLIDTGSDKILIDTGLGDGALYDGLASEGIGLDEITQIIITHGHGDHIMGILNDDNELMFPNAHYWINAVEWDEWNPGRERYSELQERIKTAVPEDRIHLVSGEGEFMAGFSPMFMPGHCKGMMGVVVQSEGESLLHIADVMHHPVQVKYPDWCVHFDSDKPKARETRRTVWQRAADENMLVFSYHVWKSGRGWITQDGDTFHWDYVVKP